jgi:lysyl-tRNA synthetase class II
MSKRRSGQKLIFYDLEGQGGRIQLMALASKHQTAPGTQFELPFLVFTLRS